jgi:hypothetical protein
VVPLHPTSCTAVHRRTIVDRLHPRTANTFEMLKVFAHMKEVKQDGSLRCAVGGGTMRRFTGNCRLRPHLALL